MILSFPNPPTTTALAKDGQAQLGVTCPMCHTPAGLMQSAIDKGADWRCGRCGQHWDATRLLAVGAYTAWVADRAAGERL